MTHNSEKLTTKKQNLVRFQLLFVCSPLQLFSLYFFLRET